jgi:hypothetical protein
MLLFFFYCVVPVGSLWFFGVLVGFCWFLLVLVGSLGVLFWFLLVLWG